MWPFSKQKSAKVARNIAKAVTAAAAMAPAAAHASEHPREAKASHARPERTHRALHETAFDAAVATLRLERRFQTSDEQAFARSLRVFFERMALNPAHKGRNIRALQTLINDEIGGGR